MSITPFAVTWAALALVVLILAAYRRVVANKEDDFVHVAQNVASQQEAVAKKLAVIDRWGKLLTIIAVVYALAIVAILFYNQWQVADRPIQ